VRVSDLRRDKPIDGKEESVQATRLPRSEGRASACPDMQKHVPSINRRLAEVQRHTCLYKVESIV
jgi:hypothetical protein